MRGYTKFVPSSRERLFRAQGMHVSVWPKFRECVWLWCAATHPPRDPIRRRRSFVGTRSLVATPDNGVAMSVAEFARRALSASEAQWERAGGHALLTAEHSRALAKESRSAFAVLQSAAAMDHAAAALRKQLCETNNSGSESPPAQPRTSVLPPIHAMPTCEDDVSDGSDLQGSLIARNIRAGKETVRVPAGDGGDSASQLAPDGSARLIAHDVLSPAEIDTVIAGGLVAMAGAFSRCGQTTLGISPALGGRMLGTAGGAHGSSTVGGPGGSPAGHGADPAAALPLLYRAVERARRRVSEFFGAALDDLRVSDATLTRLQPVADGSAAGEAALEAATCAGALDVGLLRRDQFVYWRPHIDQVQGERACGEGSVRVGRGARVWGGERACGVEVWSACGVEVWSACGIEVWSAWCEERVVCSSATPHPPRPRVPTIEAPRSAPPPLDQCPPHSQLVDRFPLPTPRQVSVHEYEFSALLYLTRHAAEDEAETVAEGEGAAAAAGPLSAAAADFRGGRLVFHDPDYDRLIHPQPGMLVAFTSGAANLHAVERVTHGTRLALTMWFTRRHASGAEAAADPTHAALQRWAVEAEGRAAADALGAAGAASSEGAAAAEAAAAAAAANGEPFGGGLPPLPPYPRAKLPSRDEALISAALCSLPANDPLGRALLLAHARGGTPQLLSETMAHGTGLPIDSSHAAPSLAPPSTASATAPPPQAYGEQAPSLVGVPAPLHARAAVLEALLTTLHRARHERAGQPPDAAVAAGRKQPRTSTPPPPAAAGEGCVAQAQGAGGASDAFSVFDL